MENKFYKVMKSRTDEDLLDIYKDQAKYTPEAIEAMVLVLKERNLLEQGIEAYEHKKEQDNLSKEERYNQFIKSEFGKIISDVEFAEENLSGSTYIQKNVSPLHNGNWANHVFIILGITGTVLAIIFIGIGEFQSPFLLFLTLSLICSLLLPLGIWKLTKNKAQLSIIKRGSGVVLLISSNKDDLEITLPMKYEFYWRWHYIRLNLKQVHLSIFLYDDKNNRIIEIRELLELHKSPPPHWEEIPKNIISLPIGKPSHVFLGHGFQKPFLIQLQRILNGIHIAKKN